jgi:hypothetical protein
MMLLLQPGQPDRPAPVLAEARNRRPEKAVGPNRLALTVRTAMLVWGKQSSGHFIQTIVLASLFSSWKTRQHRVKIAPTDPLQGSLLVSGRTLSFDTKVPFTV